MDDKEENDAEALRSQTGVEGDAPLSWTPRAFDPAERLIHLCALVEIRRRARRDDRTDATPAKIDEDDKNNERATLAATGASCAAPDGHEERP
jgi:hypothetical protein